MPYLSTTIDQIIEEDSKSPNKDADVSKDTATTKEELSPRSQTSTPIIFKYVTPRKEPLKLDPTELTPITQVSSSSQDTDSSESETENENSCPCRYRYLQIFKLFNFSWLSKIGYWLNPPSKADLKLAL